MKKYTTLALSATIAASLLGFGSSAYALSTLVHVNLRDGDAGMEVDIDRNRAVAGPVSFAVTNKSPNELVHEMLVLKVDSDNPTLPFDEATGRIPEDKIHALGEVSELEPGEGGALTLNLKAGTYLLFCNKPGHFKSGMRTLFHVQE